MVKNILVFALSVIMLTACGKEDKVMEEFQTFYDAFHQDTVFQLEQIVFPLEGIPAGADSLIASNTKYFWQQDEWVCHKPYDFVYGEFSHQFIQYSEDLIAERIEHNTGSYGMLRRFAKYGNEWYLIYYASANRLKPKPKITIEGGF